MNAVGESKFWNHSVIFVIWDDWGGWYDHVPPPQLDYDGLGFRVPMLCISPYALQGVVSHTQYESSSIVRYVEANYGLPTMADADARSDVGRGWLFAVGSQTTPVHSDQPAAQQAATPGRHAPGHRPRRRVTVARARRHRPGKGGATGEAGDPERCRRSLAG